MIDNQFLESLLGYNARRVALVAIEAFLKDMAAFGLKPVEFSVLALIHENQGITSGQICRTLGLHPPNLVGIVNMFEQRQLITRQPHPNDKRAIGLHVTLSAKRLFKQARAVVEASDRRVGSCLTATEQRQLAVLLKKVYKS